MTEIYKNTSTNVTLDVYGSSVTGTPTAVLNRADGTTLALDVDEVVPAGLGATSTWSAFIPFAETNAEGEVTVEWEAEIDAETTTLIKHYKIATPYANPYQIASRLGWQFDDPGSAGYQDYDRLVAAELVARTIIDLISGQNYGSRMKSVTSWGQNVDVLTLPERIVSVIKVYQNDELIYDASADPVYNYWGYEFVPTDTNRAIRLKASGINFDESEQYSVVYNSGQFRYGSRYEVYGEFGFESVPDAIFEAMILLVNDLMCQDSVYRIKYIGNVQVKDWKFTYNAGTWTGTGNALADDLVSSQKVQPVWVI